MQEVGLSSGGDENLDPRGGRPRRGRKRRSITETHPAKNPLIAGPPLPGNIFFETDLWSLIAVERNLDRISYLPMISDAKFPFFCLRCAWGQSGFCGFG